MSGWKKKSSVETMMIFDEFTRWSDLQKTARFMLFFIFFHFFLIGFLLLKANPKWWSDLICQDVELREVIMLMWRFADLPSAAYYTILQSLFFKYRDLHLLQHTLTYKRTRYPYNDTTHRFKQISLHTHTLVYFCLFIYIIIINALS